MTLPKWRAVFGYRSESHPEKSVTEHDIAGISTDPSNPDVTPQILEAPTTQVELVPREPPASSVAEPTTSTVQPTSLTSHNSTTRKEPEAVTPQLLWDPAYGLRRMDEGKTKYIIFGHEFVSRDQVAQTARSIQSMRALVDEVVRVFPQASLAWAGVCTILPILTNSVAAEEANRGRFTYVTSPPRLAAKLRREFEDHLVNFYQHILKFQVRTVLRFQQTRLAKLGNDAVKHEVRKGMLSKMQEPERIFDSDLRKIND
ncbi:hypothetical protein NCS55_01470600 [Fusarium keratoplasticum]|nr:hypothetical protein NCS55_01470600 [Fusarium keratoplasticum]